MLWVLCLEAVSLVHVTSYNIHLDGWRIKHEGIEKQIGIEMR